jgi:pilus assembly protein CpaF
MGLIQSLNVPYDGKKISEFHTNSTIVSKLLDQIIIDFAGLIADIEDQKVDKSVLDKEIEKRISSQKGIYEPDEVKQLIFDTIYGYGALQPLISDSNISDIDIPRYDYILIKREGQIEKSPLKFESEAEFERFCKLLIIRHGGMINEVDNHCRVSDKVNHLRINVCIPPRNVNGTSLNIRKHAIQSLHYSKLRQLGFIDERSHNILTDLNLTKSNVLICGKGAAGKTTLLRTLIDSGDDYERVLICETDVELYPQKQNVIVQSIKKNEFGGKTMTLSDLIREGLTMSLDTYCIGEIVGGEAWDFIKAGYTDHRVMATIHASNAHDALDRLLMLIENETRIMQTQLMQMISKSVGYIIYVHAFKLTEIIKVHGYDPEHSKYMTDCVYNLNEVNI